MKQIHLSETTYVFNAVVSFDINVDVYVVGK